MTSCVGFSPNESEKLKAVEPDWAPGRRPTGDTHWPQPRVATAGRSNRMQHF